MRVARLILGAVFMLFGAFRLYRAFQIHGDSYALSAGGVCLLCGVLFVARSSSPNK
jgi:hypothetical protein